jgi:uncharacterized protein (DUF58 family)
VGRGFEVVIVSPSPIPIVRQSVRLSPSVDLACRLWVLDRRARAAALQRLGLTVIEWNPNESLEAALGAIGRARRRGVAS